MATIKYEADGFAAASKTDLRDVQRDVWGTTGKYWHANYKAVKFTRRGYRLYNYTPRKGDPGSGRRFKGSYQEAKLLKKPLFSKSTDGFDSTAPLPIGEVKPNVWSGRSRASALANNKVEATARSSGSGKVVIYINAPALNFHLPSSKVRPRDEVTAIIDPELREMEKVGVNRFEAKLLKLRKRKTIKG